MLLGISTRVLSYRTSIRIRRRVSDFSKLFTNKLHASFFEGFPAYFGKNFQHC